MTGETGREESGWTVDTLHAFFIRLLVEADRHSDERDRRYEERFQSQREAVSKVENATQLRFESVNEFRAQSLDLIHNGMPRKEAEAISDRLNQRIDEVILRINQMDVLTGTSTGRETGIRLTAGLLAGLLVAMASIAGVVGTVVALVAR